MDIEGGRGTVVCNINYSPGQESEEDQMIVMTMMMDLRRGPWTAEEDLTLINYISKHGEGRWNSLARSAGLKRTGKSCRLRWLNYLRPDVRRGNITLQEQLLILELHSRWGNRWSKIAQHLPGRTDNEIKNYWRTRVQKHAKQLKCDVNSKQFKDTLRYLWMPRLVERIQAAAAPAATNINLTSNEMALPSADNSSAATSSDSLGARVSPVSDFADNYIIIPANQDCYSVNLGDYSDCLVSPSGCFEQWVDFQGVEQTTQWSDGGDTSDNGWNVEDILFLQQKISNV